MKKTKKPSDISKYKNYKSAFQKLERHALETYVNNIIEPNENEDERQPKQKKFWSYIKSLRKDNSGISPLKDKGRLFNSAKDTANILNKQYMSVFTKETDTNIPTPSGTPFPEMDMIDIKEEGILKLLRNINPRKATGPDNIPARLLRDYAVDLAPILTLIFQASAKEEKVPYDWTQANVSAIFKKGSRQDPANYRPVSLTSISCKLMEHIIVSHTMRHLEQHNILHGCQHGFRAKRSCDTQLLTLAHELAASLNKRVQTDMKVLDFSKAFDRVPHQRLLRKLDHYGIRGLTHSWISSFLHGRTQRVLVQGQSSDEAPVISGVPQGSVLGLFFSLSSSTTFLMDFCPTPDSSRTTASSTVRSGPNMTKNYYSPILTPSLDGNRNGEWTSILRSVVSCE